MLAIIGNTVRLEIFNRRAEIEVTKLVGGSNAFVRRPFLYTGLYYGLLGALLATLLVLLGLTLLNGPVGRLADSYGSAFRLHDPRPAAKSAACWGWVACWACWGPGWRPPATWPASSPAPDATQPIVFK